MDTKIGVFSERDRWIPLDTLNKPWILGRDTRKTLRRDTRRRRKLLEFVYPGDSDVRNANAQGSVRKVDSSGSEVALLSLYSSHSPQGGNEVSDNNTQ